jgi:predicted phosphodiesterase
MMHTNQNPNCNKPDGKRWVVNRRGFLKSAVAAAAGSAFLPISCAPNNISVTNRRSIRFGIVADSHYADADTVGTRFYRESLDKLTECVKLMNAKGVDFLVELGDFKDQNTPPVERKTIGYLQKIEEVFQQFNGPIYHVIGNHDLDSISKQQFLSHVENTGIDAGSKYYSFDFRGLHFIVLDANYKADGVEYDHGNFDWTDANIPQNELDWLRQDLAITHSPTIVFIHQLLDGVGTVYIKNAAEIRQILEESGKVLAVFQGHHHEGRYSIINGIHYYTLKGMIEGSGQGNNAYAIVEVRPDFNIIVTGYRKATSKRLIYSPVSQIVASPIR